MAREKTRLHQRIESGAPILIMEVSPPHSGDAAPLGELARRCAGKVHALGLSDNRDRVCMSALAAATIVAAEGVEPILHVVTRDRNRIALMSECLGAIALDVRNVLCTSGTHTALGHFRQARNVFDIDSIQLLQAYRNMAVNATLVGEDSLDGSVEKTGPLCLGAVAAPMADPLELQVMRLAKKVAAGAQFFITQPVYDVERFTAWWSEVTRRGIHQQVAVLAGIQPLATAEAAAAAAEKRPASGVPEAVLGRIASGDGPAAQRAAGLEIARETIERLAALPGLRGFEICVDGDVEAALELLETSGLGKG
jgi:methylenetetrahydrofolate reductase (NADPH)